MAPLRPWLERIRRQPGRAAVLGAAVLLALLVLRPTSLPLAVHTVTLAELYRERAALRAEVAAKEAANARRRAAFLGLKRQDPFLMEHAARSAGFLRAREFDYLAAGEALGRPGVKLASCPPAASRPQ